jgi:UDP-N-acetylmuramyl pentapeptide synthase
MRKLLILLLLIGGGRIFATILIYGDTRNHPEVHQKLVERTKELDVNAIFFTGDMNRKGTSQTEYDDVSRDHQAFHGSLLPGERQSRKKPGSVSIELPFFIWKKLLQFPTAP